MVSSPDPVFQSCPVPEMFPENVADPEEIFTTPPVLDRAILLVTDAPPVTSNRSPSSCMDPEPGVKKGFNVPALNKTN